MSVVYAGKCENVRCIRQKCENVRCIHITAFLYTSDIFAFLAYTSHILPVSFSRF